MAALNNKKLNLVYVENNKSNVKKHPKPPKTKYNNIYEKNPVPGYFTGNFGEFYKNTYSLKQYRRTNNNNNPRPKKMQRTVYKKSRKNHRKSKK